MKRLDPDKMITLVMDNFNSKDNITAGNLLALLEDSIVDEEEKVECKHEWVAHVNGDIKCKHCPAINPAPDPIIEVYEQIMKSIPECTHTIAIYRFATDMWQAITKYAEGKGKK